MSADNVKPKEAASPTAIGVKSGGQEFSHPWLTEARDLVTQGRAQEAADKLLALVDTGLPVDQQAQLLVHAANFLKTPDAERAETVALRATELAPQFFKGWVALSHVREARRNKAGAIEAAVRALKCRAKVDDVLELAAHLVRLGAEKEAQLAARKGAELAGQRVDKLPFALRVALQLADWDLAESIMPRLTKAHADGPPKGLVETPRTHLLWNADEATNLRVIARFAEQAFPVRKPMVTAPWPDDGRRKLRVGYLSSDYRDHATSLLALGLMRHHDATRVELYAYCTSHDDGSALRRDMLSRFHKVRSLSRLSDHDAAALIAKDQIDVLVDWNGLTEGTRLGVLSHRPAPVQASYLGFPGSSGGRFIDYVIADDHTVPAGVEVLYPEKVVRIPHTYQINDYRARYLPPTPSRARAGLPAEGLVIGMFNNVNKLRREVWAVWMDILRQVPGAILWMLDPGKLAQEHLRAETKRCGIDPARLVFAPRCRQEAHLARLALCDITVDPWPYGGHTTTADALFAGVPVVALRGTNFAGRVSGGLLHAAGLGMLECADRAAYVAMAVHLLNHPQEVRRVRQHLLSRRLRMPVFDAPARTLQLETAWLQMHRLAQQGKSPRHIHVKAPARSPAKSA